MYERAKEYLGLTCNLFMILILCALPLYMKEGYWQLGDAKYILFRNTSLICFLLWVIVGSISLWGALKRVKDGKTIRWSWLDSFVLAYGMVNVLSYMLSDYQDTAWRGYEQWYMGLLSQLLFVWIYFFISRQYNGSHFCLWIGVGTLFLVALLGVLNRLMVDPLGLFQGLLAKDWDYSHLLSTVGNINWLCGYFSVLFPFVLMGYLLSNSRSKKLFFYSASLLTSILLCIQGSSSGLLILGMAMVCLFVWGLSEKKRFQDVMLLGGGFSFVLPLLGLIFEKQGWQTFPVEDGWLITLISSGGWFVLSAVFAIGYVLSMKLTFKKVRRIGIAWAVLLCMGAVFVILLPGIRSWEMDYSWGSSRGGLWTLAIKSFERGGIRQKLLGVGPDCFGRYVYEFFPAQEYVTQEGPFSNATFTNAHNEWLNQLVNIGILGLICYAGIFAAAIFRFLKRAGKDAFLYLGVLAALFYGVNALISFQQVMNAPFLFLTFGICERRCRNEMEEI